MQVPLEVQDHCFRLLHAQQWTEVVESICSHVEWCEKSRPGNFQTWPFHDRKQRVWRRLEADSDSNDYDEIESANWGGFSRDAVANDERVWIHDEDPFLYKNATYVIVTTEVSTFSTRPEVTEEDPDAVWLYY